MRPVLLLLAVVVVAAAAVLVAAPFKSDDADEPAAGECTDEVGRVISCRDSEALYVARPAGARGCSAESRTYAAAVRDEVAGRLDDSRLCLHLIGGRP
jgi:hypothetical protein